MQELNHNTTGDSETESLYLNAVPDSFGAGTGEAGARFGEGGLKGGNGTGTQGRSISM